MPRKWFPVGTETVIETGQYRYVIGVYNHAKYGPGCFRVSKFLLVNGYFIGHFVIVPEDQAVLVGTLVEALQALGVK